MRLSSTCLLFGCFILVLQLLLPPSTSAKLYTWTDRNGTVRRTYYPPPANQVRKSQPQEQVSYEQETVGENQVELYVTSWCPYCKQAEEFFQSRDIAYEAYDIEEDEEAAARKKQLDKKSGVPFAVINGARIHGYSPKGYANALK